MYSYVYIHTIRSLLPAFWIEFAATSPKCPRAKFGLAVVFSRIRYRYPSSECSQKRINVNHRTRDLDQCEPQKKTQTWINVNHTNTNLHQCEP